MDVPSITVISVGLNLNSSPNFLQNILRILSGAYPGDITVILARSDPLEKIPIDKKIFVIRTNPDDKSGSKNFIDRVIGDLSVQLSISFVLLRNENSEYYLFFLSQSLVLPIVLLKLLGRKTILVLGASNYELAKSRKGFLSEILKFEEYLSCNMVDKIILYSNILIKQWHLRLYKSKIYIAHKNFINPNQFKIERPLDQRKKFIGYIGRFSEEKGVINLLKSIPILIKQKRNLNLILIGKGPLSNEINIYINKNNLSHNIQILDWVPFSELPKYLNNIKLIIVPSFTEGLPNIMLEAMACGTPVLATTVGAIPDIIKDGETGFLMESNSPDCIAVNIIRALNHAELDNVVQCARTLVEREFTFDKAVERWKKVLVEVGDE